MENIVFKITFDQLIPSSDAAQLTTGTTQRNYHNFHSSGQTTAKLRHGVRSLFSLLIKYEQLWCFIVLARLRACEQSNGKAKQMCNTTEGPRVFLIAPINAYIFYITN